MLQTKNEIAVPYGNTSKEEALRLLAESISNSLKLCQHLISTQLGKDFWLAHEIADLINYPQECKITFFFFKLEKGTKLDL